MDTPQHRMEEDLGSLAWVLAEMRTTWGKGIEALRQFQKTPGDTALLEPAKNQFHQICGVLDMVGSFMPAMVLRHGEMAVERFIANPALCTDKAIHTLEQAGQAVAEYMESLLQGENTPALTLFLPYRNVRTLAAGIPPASPADLWSLEGELHEPDIPVPTKPLAPNQKVRDLIDQMVLKIIQGTQQQEAAGQLVKICLGLAADSSHFHTRTFWKVAAGFFEALAHDSLPSDIYVKRTASRVLVQYASLAEDSTKVIPKGMQDLLFFCAQAQPQDAQPSPILNAVRTAFGLNRHVPFDYNRQYFWLIPAHEKEALNKLLDDIAQSCSDMGESSTHGLSQCLVHFKELNRHLPAHVPGSADFTQSLVDAASDWASSGQTPSHGLLLEIAADILYVRALLTQRGLHSLDTEQHIAQLHQRLETVRKTGEDLPIAPWMETLYKQVNDADTTKDLANELRGVLAEVEMGLDVFFQHPENTATLERVPDQLQQIHNILAVLGLEQAALVAQRVCEQVQAFIAQTHDSANATLGLNDPRFADIGNNIGALGLQLDMLAYQPALAQKLFIYDPDAASLKPALNSIRSPGHADEDFFQFVQERPQDVPSTYVTGAEAQETDPVESTAAQAPEPATAQGVIPLMAAAIRGTGLSLLPPQELPTEQSEPPASATLPPEEPGQTEYREHASDISETTAAPTAVEAETPAPSESELELELELPALELDFDLGLSTLSIESPAADLPSDIPEIAPTDTGAIFAPAQHPIALPDGGEPVETVEAVEAAPPPAQAETVPALEEDDDDLLGIFLDEAQGVIDNGQAALAQLALTPGDIEQQTTLRRALHTLKGSSRMVGLMEFGEAAWAMEQLLNAWLAGQKPFDPSMQALCTQVLAAMNNWVADIYMRDHAHWQAQPFIESADAMRLQGQYIPLASEDQGETIAPSTSPAPQDIDRTSTPEPVANATEQPLPAPVADNLPQEEAAAHGKPPLPVTPTPEALCTPPAVSESEPLSSSNATAHPYQDVLSDQVDADLFPIFEEEAIDLLPQLVGALRRWADHPAHSDARREALRILHTLKGSSRLAGAMHLGEMAHEFESHIGALETCDAHSIAPLLTQYDHLQAAFDALRSKTNAALEQGMLATPNAGLGDIHAVYDIVRSTPQATLVAAPTPEPVATSHSTPEEAFPADDTPFANEPEISIAEDEQPAYDNQPFEPEEAQDLEPTPAETDDESSHYWRAGRHAELPGPTPLDIKPAPVNRQTLRVRSDLINRLINQAGEIQIARARAESRLKQLSHSLKEMTGSLERLRHQLRELEVQAESQMQSRMSLGKEHSDFDPLEFDRFTRVQELTRMMAETVNDVATVQRGLQVTMSGAEDDLVEQGMKGRELQRDLLRSRMVEFNSITERLHALVRQAALETGKQIHLEIDGGNIEIDRSLLDRMTPAFEHLLRNCVSHGIELPEERLRLHKTETGAISIRVSQEGNDVAFEFHDDGKGLDLPAIRAKAVERGLIQAQDTLSDDELANLIFLPGFTTMNQVTGLAGRGIGMDVVRTELNTVGGRIETSTVAQRGSTFRMVMPLTTAVTQVMLVRIGNITLGIPANQVENIHRADPKQLSRAYASRHFAEAGVLVPFYWAGALLQHSVQSTETIEGTTPIILVRSASQRLALHVDEIIGNQEVVVKNLGPQIASIDGLTGMSVLASGAILLIYNFIALNKSHGQTLDAQGQGSSTTEHHTPALGESAFTRSVASNLPLVLVVDDSITVRRVTQRLLKREGYRVELAADGVQALEKLEQERPTVVLSDIEMPKMDGFELLRHIRAQAQWQDLPIIMITSRTAQKHKERANELGANHYLGKPYSDKELLALVGQYAAAQARPILPE